MTKDSLAEKFLMDAAAAVITLPLRMDAMTRLNNAISAIMAKAPELTQLDYAAIDQHNHIMNCEEPWDECQLCNMQPDEWFDYWQRLDAEEDV